MLLFVASVLCPSFGALQDALPIVFIFIHHLGRSLALPCRLHLHIELGNLFIEIFGVHLQCFELRCELGVGRSQHLHGSTIGRGCDGQL
jgi:hypothetical protein